MARLRELFAPDAVIYGVLGQGGIDQVERIWRELHQALNIRLEVVAIAAEGNEVAVRFRETGRFVGPFRGLPGQQPTGRGYDIVAMEWFVVEHGRIRHRWGTRDSGAITRQVLEA